MRPDNLFRLAAGTAAMALAGSRAGEREGGLRPSVQAVREDEVTEAGPVEYVDPDDLWQYEPLDDEDQEVCSGHSPDGDCPECCVFGGSYAPGTEQCMFRCAYGDYCAEAWERMGFPPYDTWWTRLTARVRWWVRDRLGRWRRR